MKTILLQIGKKPVSSELIKDPAHRLHVLLARVFGIDQNIIQIYDNEDVELLSEDLVDVTLETGLKGGLSFIALSNSHTMVDGGQAQLGETPSSAKAVQGLTNQKQQIPILDSQVVEASVINRQLGATIWFLIEKDG